MDNTSNEDIYTYAINSIYNASNHITNNTRSYVEEAFALPIPYIKAALEKALDQMPKAAGDAILIDGLITAGLMTTGFMPFTGSIIAMNIAGAIAGYTIRKTIDEYFKEDTTLDYTTRIFGGAVGGAIKYGISKDFTLEKMTIGAVNNALYEYMKQPIGSNIEGGNVFGLFSTILQIETTDGIIEVCLENKLGISSFIPKAATIMATSVLSMSIWTFDNKKGYTELDYHPKNVVDGLLAHTYNLMMGTPIKTKTDNIDDLYPYTFTCPASETLDNTNGDQPKSDL